LGKLVHQPGTVKLANARRSDNFMVLLESAGFAGMTVYFQFSTRDALDDLAVYQDFQSIPV